MSLTKFISKELRKSRRLRGNLKGCAAPVKRKPRRVSSRETVGKDQTVELRPIPSQQTSPQPFKIQAPSSLVNEDGSIPIASGGQFYTNSIHTIMLDTQYRRKIPRNMSPLIRGPTAFGLEELKTQSEGPSKRATPALDEGGEIRLGMRMAAAEELLAAERLAKEAERLEELERTNAAIRREFERQAEIRRMEELAARAAQAAQAAQVKPEPPPPPQVIPLSDPAESTEPTLGDRIHQARVNQQANRAFNNAQAAPPPETFPGVEYTTPMQEDDYTEESKTEPAPIPSMPQMQDSSEMETGDDPPPEAPLPPMMASAPRAYQPVRNNINAHVSSPQQIIQPVQPTKMTEAQALLPQLQRLVPGMPNLQGGSVRGDAVLQNYRPTQEAPPGYLPALQHMENYRDPYFIMNKETLNGIRRRAF